MSIEVTIGLQKIAIDPNPNWDFCPRGSEEDILSVLILCCVEGLQAIGL